MPTAESEKKLVRKITTDGTTKYLVILPDGSKHPVDKQDAAVKGIVAVAEAALKKVFDETEASLASGVRIGFANVSANF
jgi:hypothetical protein